MGMMVDDFYNPAKPDQDCHSCDCSNSIKPEQKDFCEAPNMKDVWFRLPELITDPASNQLSCSRLVLAWMGMVTVALVVDAIYLGQIAAVTSLVMAVAGTAAGVYFMSTAKDWRWRKWRDKD